MFQQWEDFGIPSVITSDRGPHFAFSWWQTLCAEFNVRAAWSQPYHHQGNGRAEVAGHQVRDMLSRLVVDVEEPKANWVELLPKALRLLRDMPNPLTGLSPYEYVHGRSRGLAGLPYKPAQVSIDATRWLKHQRELTEVLVERVNEEHRKRVEQIYR